MQKSKSQIISDIEKKLKKYFKNEIIFDIVIIGSYLKDKETPRDIDFLIIFTHKDYKTIEELSYQIKEDILQVIKNKEIHIETIILHNLFKEKIFSAILHEGFSIRNNEFFSELTGFKACSLFVFSLNNLSKVEKVKFSQAIYGRKKDGLLYQEKGESLGKGSLIVPVEKEELFRQMMDKWKIKYKLKRILIK